MTGSCYIDYHKLSRDYNHLGVNEVLSFLVLYEQASRGIPQALSRRGLVRGRDFVVRTAVVLSPLSFNAISQFPQKPVSEAEFADYACLCGRPYPDPVKHPGVFAADKILARRSNRNVTSDSLPILSNVRQVYIIKKSSRNLNRLPSRGRPRKKGK